MTGDDATLRFVARPAGGGVTVVLESASSVLLIDPIDGVPVADGVAKHIDVLLSVGGQAAVETAMQLGERLTASGAASTITIWNPPDEDGETVTPRAGGAQCRQADPGLLIEDGPCIVHAYATSHTRESRGYVLYPAPRDSRSPDTVRATLVWSGPTRPCYATVEIAQGAQLLVHDATHFAADGATADDLGSSTGAEAARVAAAANVDRLILNPSRAIAHDAAERMVEEAARLFRPVELARGGVSFDLGAGAIRGAGRVGGL